MFWFNFNTYLKYAWSPQIRNSLIIIGILIILTVIFGHFLKKKDPNAKPGKLQLIFEEAVKLNEKIEKVQSMDFDSELKEKIISILKE